MFAKLRILTHLQKYWSAYEKYMYIWEIGTLRQIGILRQLFMIGSFTQIFKKNKVVSGKSPLFVIDPLCTPIQFDLTLAFDRAVLHGNVARLFLVLWT